MPRPGVGHERLVKIAAELAAWWVVAVGVWMASLSAFSGQDLIVAMACAVPCAAAAIAARRAIDGAWRPPREAVGWMALWPWEIVIGTAKVLTLPLRRSAIGELRRIDLAVGRETKSRAAGGRAFATLMLSATPATFVVTTDDENGTALAHAIGPPSPLERRLSK